MKRLFLTAALLLAFTGSALAHGDEGPVVRLPGEGTIVSPAMLQRGMLLSKANTEMQRFLIDNPGWDYRYNDVTGNPHRAWGRGIRIEGFPLITELNAASAGMAFIRAHARVLRVEPEKIRLLSSIPANGKIYQKYVQVFNGVDVLNSYVDLRLTQDGKVIMFGSDYQPGITVSTLPSIGRDAAASFSTAGLKVMPPADAISGGELFVLPLEYPTWTDYRLVYRFLVDVSAEEQWETHVDAHSGAILWRRNLVHSLSGDKNSPVRAAANTVTGQITISIYVDSYSKGATTVPLPSAHISIGGKQYITDAEGRFTADIGTELTSPVVTRLAGPYAIARRADSTSTLRNARITTSAVSGQELNLFWDDANSTAAERNVFYHVTRVRNYFRGIDTSATLSDMDKQLQGIVNINQTCNAFWDPSKKTLNFYKAGNNCGNTGEIADVVYHEYGHGLQQFMYTKIRRSGISNQALGEAISDITANMMRDDPRMGIGFFTNGANDGILRNADNNYVYPKDLFGEYHDNGQILSGAVWDMRRAIGIDAARRLTHFALYGTPDGTSDGEAFADYFIEILVADDDDGDLSNGTPNSAGIIPAFVKHGIPASGMTLAHDALSDQKSVTDPYPVNGSILVGAAINRNLLKVADVQLVYTTDGWKTSMRVPMTVNDQTRTFSGHFPAQKAGTIARYYFEATDNYGSTFRHPLNAPTQDFLVLIGYDSKVMYDAEVIDSWTTESECQTGKWVRDKPIGTYNSALGTPPDAPWVQPNEDHTIGITKTRCWLTGNAPIGSDLGENDVDDGSNDLITRAYDISAMEDPVIRYYRWYSNDQGMNPNIDAWMVRVSSDGGSTWTYIENTHEANASWASRVFRIRDYVELTDKFMVKFSAADSVTDKPSLVEAALDDFEILDIDMSLVGVERTESHATEFAIEQNYPNPFNPATSIAFSLPAPTHATLRVYSSLGTLVSTLAEGSFESGRHRVVFDAAHLASGVYTCVLQSEGRMRAITMTLMK